MKKREPKSGKIYVVTNDCFEKVQAWGRFAKYGKVAPVKIGRAKDVDYRIGSLSTGVPDDFIKHLVLHVEDYVSFEDLLQSYFCDYRIPTKRTNSKTEFFAVPIKEVIRMIKKMVAFSPDRCKIEHDYGEKGKSEGRSGSAQKRNRQLEEEWSKSVKQAKKGAKTVKRGPFRFSMCVIKPGEKVAFVNDPSKQAKVVDDRHVRYGQETMSLSMLARQLTGVQHELQGPIYFTYKGELLDDLRKRLEK